jgi:8-oxo-dGTP pyrophosphatase MutT (NUDIX family)
MFTCEEDGTVLLLLRAEWVEQGGTWGIPGGGIGEGFYRTPMQPLTDMRVFRAKAEEEVREECGSLPPDTRTRRPMTSLPEGLAFTEYEDCGFRYVTFLCDLTREQKAAWKPYSADGENDAFVWFPLRAVKAGRPLPDEYGDERDIHFGVSFTMANLPMSLSRTNPRRPATTAERTDPALWEAVKREVTAGTKGGVPGEWSARKAQLAVALYKKRGGGYLGPKSPQNALAKWTREDWRTRSGEPSLVTGERYLPARAIAALTPAEYAATSRVKRAGLLRDEQFTAQPERIAAKTAKYRRK